ncbi:MAG TPA: hypothetical protein VGK59_22290 [Ohtaekwangia sp.]
MNTTPKFHRTLWGHLQSNMDVSYWPVTTDAWKQGRYLDSFFALLDYINPSLRKTFGNAAQNEFLVPHGSIIVKISIQGDSIEVNSDFVNITGALRIPLLRKVAELNFYPLGLSQIRMSGDNLNFHYRCTLDTGEPFKMYYVLKEICKTADQYDDDFREKFKTKNLVEPKVVQCTQQEADQAWITLKDIINDTLTFANYFDSQRWYNQTFDILNIGLKRIDYAVQPQGFIKNEIERVNAEMGNQNTNVMDRNQYARTLLGQLQQMPKEQLAKSLYKSEIFVPEKWNLNLEGTQRNLDGFAANAQKYLNEQNYIMAVMECLYAFYNLFYSNYVEKHVSDEINAGLEAASGKNWNEAAPALVRSIMNVKNGTFQTPSQTWTA